MKLVATFLLLALSFSFYSCDDVEPAEHIESTPVVDNPDPVEPDPTAGQVVFGQPFIKHSELYDLLIQATQNIGDPMEDIICINFVYPFIIKKYDSSMTAIETTTMNNDPEFYNYLVALAPTQPISLSYPISTLNSNGDLLSINNNAELADALKQCHEQAVILYCSGTFAGTPDPLVDCYWRVPYYPGADNTYAGGIFLVDEDGSLVFHYNGQNYPGNWIFLFVNGVPHMNINLEGTSDVANFWNIDRQVYTTQTDITIMSEPANIRLEKYCGTADTYTVGDTGPANGIVFYDKGEYSDGWRYKEVTPNDMPSVQWGCQGSIAYNGTASNNGMINSARVAGYHDASGFYQNPTACNSQNDGTVAAKSALSWQYVGVDDWYLPSEQELQLIYTNLTAASLGNLSGGLYWSSTEESASKARTVNFNNGNASGQLKTDTSVKTRAIRYF
jgi:hypothetical protein